MYHDVQGWKGTMRACEINSNFCLEGVRCHAFQGVIVMRGCPVLLVHT